MDKNTLFAVILSTVVIVVGFMIQAKVNPAPEQEVTKVPAIEQTIDESENIKEAPRQQAVSSNELQLDTDAVIEEKIIKAETNRFIITFSNKGGVITSLKLKEHMDKGKPLEMIFTADDEQAAFDIAFGGPDAVPLRDTFEYILDKLIEIFQ